MISSTLTIRQAEVADLDAVARLWCALQEMRTQFHDCYEPSDDALTLRRAELGEILAQENTIFSVAVEPGGQVVGYCLGSIEESPPTLTEERVGVISSMFVDRNSRDAGIGQTMLRAVTDALAREGVGRVEVTLCAENADAIRFLEAQRFELHTVTLTRNL